jgi:hypothetical protein
MSEKASETLPRLWSQKKEHHFWAAANFGELKMLCERTDFNWWSDIPVPKDIWRYRWHDRSSSGKTRTRSRNLDCLGLKVDSFSAGSSHGLLDFWKVQTVNSAGLFNFGIQITSNAEIEWTQRIGSSIVRLALKKLMRRMWLSGLNICQATPGTAWCPPDAFRRAGIRAEWSIKRQSLSSKTAREAATEVRHCQLSKARTKCNVTEVRLSQQIKIHMDNARPHNSGRTQRCIEDSRAAFALQLDLAPSDFFLFGFINGQQTDHHCQRREDLLNAITRIFIGVNQEVMLSVFESLANPLKWVIKHEGKYFFKIPRENERIRTYEYAIVHVMATICSSQLW